MNNTILTNLYEEIDNKVLINTFDKVSKGFASTQDGVKNIARLEEVKEETPVEVNNTFESPAIPSVEPVETTPVEAPAFEQNSVDNDAIAKLNSDLEAFAGKPLDEVVNEVAPETNVFDNVQTEVTPSYNEENIFDNAPVPEVESAPVVDPGFGFNPEVSPYQNAPIPEVENTVETPAVAEITPEVEEAPAINVPSWNTTEEASEEKTDPLEFTNIFDNPIYQAPSNEEKAEPTISELVSKIDDLNRRVSDLEQKLFDNENTFVNERKVA